MRGGVKKRVVCVTEKGRAKAKWLSLGDSNSNFFSIQ